MPRRKIRAHYEHMSEFETGRAIGLKEAAWSNRLIARHLCRSDAAIRRCWQKWVNNGSSNVRAAAVDQGQQQNGRTKQFTQVSKMTINRRLRERNLKARRPLRCLPLTPVHRQVRLQWCRERSTWNCADCGRIVFSDKSRFLLCPDDRPNVSGDVLGSVWILALLTPLVVIPGTLTAQRYVDDILRPVLLPFLSHHSGLTFKQDNARPHTARVTMDGLQSCRTLPWPARSPDLSPIEHIWDVMGRRLQPSRNVDYLARQLETIWQEMPQHTIRNLYQSMTRRVAACIQAMTDRSLTSRTVAQHIQSVTHHPVSAHTIQRRLQQSGLSTRRPLLRLPLTQNHRCLRSQWYDERRMWVAEWNKFVFTDESRFCLQHHDGRIRVWRHRGERMVNSCVMHRHTGPAPGIMVWGGIGYHSRTPLVRIAGTLNSQRYISEITSPAATPDQLWQHVEAAWSAVPQEHIQNIFELMPRHVATVISNKVGYSGY
ncbi:hypothetical protein LAZ67_1000569 [Cordylochernes scorpioides]|uniref:Transposase Tc1-like domain-containing protein n=1 Tax=Cordylochernes scorpioides TaxID=51811 RepID=A0ABY6JW84_9ARAC|nr:hypothetical protein LAZ67_1000569 [Cordylochernes scorpioides]